MGLSESWQGFLDSLAERGFPFLRDIANSLDEKGIPSMLVFFLVFLTIGVGVFYLASGGVILGQTGVVSLQLSDESGLPLPGVQVKLRSEDGSFDKTLSTDQSGKVEFSGVPVGAAVASVSSDNYLFDNSGVQDVDVSSSKRQSIGFVGTSLSATTVSLIVDVRGPEEAVIELFDDAGDVVDSDIGLNTVFRVNPNSVYLVRASADGFTPDEKTVSIGNADYSVVLDLLALGEDAKSTLHLGVFEEKGVDGIPLKGSSVLVSDAVTGLSIANLVAGEDGAAEPIELLLGSVVRVSASAPGFTSKTVELNVSEEVFSAKIVLSKIVGLTPVTVRVLTETNASVVNPVVRLYDGVLLVEEQTPVDGIAVFETDVRLENAYVTTYKPGFVPSVLEVLRRGENKVVLTPATPENSGAVLVNVLDYHGIAVPEAFISLQTDSKKFAGIPARVSGADGQQYFDGVGRGSYYAVASLGSRSATSTLFEVNPEFNETQVTIQFTPATAILEAVVKSSDSKNPVAGASVSVTSDTKNASCTTNARGLCRLTLLETSSAVVEVTASGFADFTSSPFALTPGAVNKQEFFLMPSGTVNSGSARIAFEGVFDLKGKRVSALAPFTQYNAKFVLKGGAFEKGLAHIRLDGVEKALSEESAGIVGYKVLRASRVFRGTSYEEENELPSEIAQVSEAKKVSIYDTGFDPTEVELKQGDKIVFTNFGNASQGVLFEKPIDSTTQVPSSPNLRTGESFTLVFNQPGYYSYRSTTNPSLTAAVAVSPRVVPTPTPQKSSSGKEFKWVEFWFQPFVGSREIVVQFKTRASGTVDFAYRAAFDNKDGSVIREPEDNEAGKTKNEALAEAKTTSSYEISFKGECQNEVCIQTFFEGGQTKDANNFEAELGSSFKLVYNLLKEGNEPISLKLSAENIDDGGALKLSEEEENQASALITQLSTEGSFQITALKLSKDARLVLTAFDAKQNPVFEKQLFVSVVSQNPPSFKVSFNPKTITALQENKLIFQVTDKFGTPVDDARVSITSNDASFTELEASPQGKGVYSVTVAPASLDALSYKITAEKFRKALGAIPISAPLSVFEVSSPSLSMSVDSFEDISEVTVDLKNRLANELQLSISVSLDSPAQYTGVSVEPTRTSLKPPASVISQTIQPPARTNSNQVPIVLKAFASDLLSPITSGVPSSLKEKVSGTISINARVRSFTENKVIPFVVNTVLTQKSLDDLWSLSDASFSIELDADSKRSVTRTITVRNDGPVSILFNQEHTLSSAIISPLSAIIQPGQTGEFTITATIDRPSDECILEDSTSTGVLTFYASYNRESSRKKIDLTKKIIASKKCVPKNGFLFTLPVSISFTLPPGNKFKANDDGSTTIQLSNGERIVVDAGAVVTQTQVNVPLNTRIMLERTRVQQLPDGVQVSLPFATEVEIPSDVDLRQTAEGLTANIGNALAIFPQGAQLLPAAVRKLVVPPNALMRFRLAPPSTLLSLLPFNPVSVKLPVDEDLLLPFGSNVEPTPKPNAIQENIPLPQNIPSGLIGVLLANAQRIAFSYDVTIRPTANGLLVRIPSDSVFVVPAAFYRRGAGETEFTLTYPFGSTIHLPANSPTTQDKTTGLYLVKISSEAVVGFPFDPSPKTSASEDSKTTRKEVAVPAGTPVTFFTGARAEELDVEDTSKESSCRLGFKANEEVLIELDDGVFVKKGNSITAKVSDCTEAKRARIISTASTKQLYESGAITRVIVQGTVPDFEEDSRTIKVPEGTEISFRACKQVSDEEKRVSISFTTGTTLVLPPDTGISGDGRELSFKGYKNIELKESTQSQSYKLNTPTNKLYIDTSGGEIDFKQIEAVKKKESKTLSIPADSRIQFIPYCDKSSDGTFSIESDSNTLEFDPKELEFELYNSQLKDVRQVCIKNIGTQEMTMTRVSVDGVGKEKKTNDLAAKTLPPDQEHMKFAERVAYGGKHLHSIQPSEQCAPYEITAVVPQELIDPDYPNCIIRDTNLEISATISFHAKDADSRKLLPKKIPAKVSISGSEKKSVCDKRKRDEQFTGLSSIVPGSSSGRFRQLYFKQPNQYNYLTLVNNREEKVFVKADSSSAMECMQAKASASVPEYEPPTGLAPLTGLSDKIDSAKPSLEKGFYMAAGESKLLVCKSKTGSSISPTSIVRQPQYDKYHIYVTSTKTNKELQEAILDVTVYYAAEQVAGIYETPTGSVSIRTADDFSSVLSTSPISVIFFEEAPKETDSQPPASTGDDASDPKPEQKDDASSDDASTRSAETDESVDAPARPIVVSSVCSDYYCTVKQAREAFSSFLAYSAEFFSYRLSEKDGVKKVCEEINQAPIALSFPLKIANSYEEISSVNQLFSKELTQETPAERASLITDEEDLQALQQTQEETQKQSEELATARRRIRTFVSSEVNPVHKFFNGCGDYIAEFRLNPVATESGAAGACFDEDPRFNLEASIIKLGDCPLHVSMAPALLGAEANKIEFISGRRVVDWPSEIVPGKGRYSKITEKLQEAGSNFDPTSPSSYLSFLDLGAFALGPYGTEVSDHDQKTLKSLFESLYLAKDEKNNIVVPDEERTKIGEQFKSITATNYEDAEYCRDKGIKQMIAVGITGLGTTVISAGATVALAPTVVGSAVSGYMTVLGGKLLLSVPSVLFGLSQGAITYATGRECTAYNSFIESEIWGATTSTIPTGTQLKQLFGGKTVQEARAFVKTPQGRAALGKYAKSTLVKESAAYSALGAAAAGALTLLDEEASAVTVPIAAGIRVAGVPLYETITGKVSGTSALQPIVEKWAAEQGITGRNKQLTKLFKEIYAAEQGNLGKGVGALAATSSGRKRLADAGITISTPIVPAEQAVLDSLQAHVIREGGIPYAALQQRFDAADKFKKANKGYLADPYLNKYSDILRNEPSLDKAIKKINDDLTKEVEAKLASAKGLSALTKTEAQLAHDLIKAKSNLELLKFQHQYRIDLIKAAAASSDPMYLGLDVKTLQTEMTALDKQIKSATTKVASLEGLNNKLIRDATFNAKINAALKDILKAKSPTAGITEGVLAGLKFPPTSAAAVEAGKGAGRVAAAAGKAKSLSGKVRGAIPAAAQLGSVLLFHVDVRPVRALLEQEKSGHVLVYHVESKLECTPSMYSACFKDSRETDGCAKDLPQLYLANSCPADKAACLYLVKVPREDDNDAYVLLASVNDEKLIEEDGGRKLFDSVFNPPAKPFGERELRDAGIQSAVLEWDGSKLVNKGPEEVEVDFTQKEYTGVCEKPVEEKEENNRVSYT